MSRLTENPAPRTTSRPRVLLTFDAGLDMMSALEFGRVSDAQPDEAWQPVDGLADNVRYLRDVADGRVFGFVARGCSDLDLHDTTCSVLWTGPRFDVPQLGLSDAPAGGVIAVAIAYFDGRNSLNRALFLSATHQDDDREALRMWSALLEAGDPLAHYGLGYTLHALGQHRAAYKHLRHYSEIAPECAWVWCWYGRAAEAVGELEEARSAYAHAIWLEDNDPDTETDAEERLEELEES